MLKIKIIAAICFIHFTFLLNGQDSSFPIEHNVVDKGEVFNGTYSNYYSFHGTDGTGEIYFAIDNNRQRKKKHYKANNFLYFNIDGEWKELKGHEKFKSQTSDPEKALSSEHFEFGYTENQLSSIQSNSNDLHIEIKKPLKKMGEYGGEGILFDIYATKATLTYKNRTVEGNLIAESLIDSLGLKTFSNFSKAIFGGFKFDAYYLNAEGFGDLYVHLIKSKAAIGFKKNIYTLGSELETKDFDLEWTDYTVTKSKRIGFKKLPLEMEIDLPDAKLKLRTTHFHKYRNVLFFAFGMGVVHGELIYKGETYTVYGLSEVFAF